LYRFAEFKATPALSVRRQADRFGAAQNSAKARCRYDICVGVKGLAHLHPGVKSVDQEKTRPGGRFSAVVFRALSSLECFDTVGWYCDGKACKNPLQLSQRFFVEDRRSNAE